MKNKLPNVHLVSLRIGHHASLSGYDQLIKRMGVQSIATVSKLSVSQRLFAKSFRSVIDNSGSSWYHRNNFITELDVMKRLLVSNNQLFHYLYGENSFRYSGMFKTIRKNNHLLATYHTPPSRFKEVVKGRKFLKNLDSIIVVSTMQINFYSDLIGARKVHYVPHGIDTEYFKPSLGKSDSEELFHCICVGNHLRDYETLVGASKILSKKTNKIKITIVASAKLREQLSDCSNVELYSGIDDERLLGFYQSADLLLLPLLDCTANNTLLEGMACGLPVVTSNLPGVHDYVDNTCAIFAEKQDAQQFADAVVSVYEDRNQLLQMAKNSRAYSKQFAWQNVITQLQSVYSKLDA